MWWAAPCYIPHSHPTSVRRARYNLSSFERLSGGHQQSDRAFQHGRQQTIDKGTLFCTGRHPAPLLRQRSVILSGNLPPGQARPSHRPSRPAQLNRLASAPNTVHTRSRRLLSSSVSLTPCFSDHQTTPTSMDDWRQYVDTAMNISSFAGDLLAFQAAACHSWPFSPPVSQMFSVEYLPKAICRRVI